MSETLNANTAHGKEVGEKGISPSAYNADKIRCPQAELISEEISCRVKLLAYSPEHKSVQHGKSNENIK